MRAVVRLWWLPVLLVASTVVLRAQSKPSVDGSMNDLVAEVRALRLAVERTAGVTARTQALLGRVQLQESRLADLGRRLDEARQRTRAATSRETTHAIELARATAANEGVPAGPDREGLEIEAKAMRARVKAAHDEAAQLRADEQDVLTALSSEQARWSDYNARLEAIEQEFAKAGGREP